MQVQPSCGAQAESPVSRTAFSIDLYLVNTVRGNLSHNSVLNDVLAEAEDEMLCWGVFCDQRSPLLTTHVTHKVSEECATCIFRRIVAWASCRCWGHFGETSGRWKCRLCSLGNHAVAGGPVSAMPIDGQGCGSGDKQGDHSYFCWEDLSFAKRNKIRFLWLYAAFILKQWTNPLLWKRKHRKNPRLRTVNFNRVRVS